MSEYDLKLLQTQMEQALDEERYRHTTGVMYTAQCLAMRYGVDLTRAGIAGVLHDCAKCIPNEQKLIQCEKYGIEISETERKNPSLLHAKLGAYLAKELYGIEDEEILSAIRWHTTGKPNMTLLEMIIYMADYIEPNRDQAPNLSVIRQMTFDNVEEALLLVLESTLDYLKDRPHAVDPMTRASCEFYEQKFKK